MHGRVAAHHDIQILLPVGHTFQTKGHIDHIPDHGVVAVLRKVSHHRLAGVECCPDLQRPGQIGNLLAEAAGEGIDGNGGFQGLVDVGLEIRPCPQGHDRVADELIDNPVMFVDQLAHPAGPMLEELGNPLVAHGFRELGVVMDVADQDGDDLFLHKGHGHLIEIRAGWRCGTGWGRFLIEKQAGAADADAIPVLQGHGGMDSAAVDKGAVGASQVNEVEAAIFFPLDHGMFPGDPGIGKHDIGVGHPTEGKGVVAAEQPVLVAAFLGVERIEEGEGRWCFRWGGHGCRRAFLLPVALDKADDFLGLGKTTGRFF